MTTDLALTDATQVVVEDTAAGRHYRLHARVDGAVTAPTADALGPALNALYAQAIAAIFVDPSLGGLAIGMVEGGDEGPAALDIDIEQEAYTGPTARFGLGLAVDYWQAHGAPPLREAILSALLDALAANQPLPDLSLREQCLAALRTHCETAVGPMLRNADRPVGAGIVFVDGSQTASYETMGRTDYATTFAVEVFRPSGTTAALEADVQALLAAVQSADRLGGLAVDVVEGDVDPETVREPYSGPMLCGRVEGVIHFATRPGQPTVAA